MATWNAVYIRDPSFSESRLLQGLRQELAGPVEVRRWHDWTELALPGLQHGESLAQRLSLDAGVEVLCCQIQTTASTVSISHHAAGARSRLLAYHDGVWVLEGTPLPWEATALFSELALEDALESCDGDAEEEARVRQVFRDRTLVDESPIPRPDEFECLWAALGMDWAQWQQLRESPPIARLQGTKGRGRVWLARAFLLGAISCVALLVGMRQPLFLFVAVLLSAAGGWLALTRWLSSGRWLS